MLFTELPFEERFAAAAKAGCNAVEYMFPYEHEPEKLVDLLKTNGLRQVLFNLPAGDWAAGDRGIAADPSRVDAFRAGVLTAVEYALHINVDRLNCLAGKLPEGVSREEAMAALTDNVRFAGSVLAAHGLTLMLECVNRFDIPGFVLNRTPDALAVMEGAGGSNIMLQYDIYHAVREGEDPAAVLRAHIGDIGHIQIADAPGRHQPGTGEISYRQLLSLLDSLGYDGHVGLEYVPVPDTQSSLDWIEQYGFSRRS